MTKFEKMNTVIDGNGNSMSVDEFRKKNDKELVDIWKNDTYQVMLYDLGNMIWLSIKRIDKEPIHDWRELQAIKNELVGHENEGFELYPAESRCVDSANQYHLWVFKDVKMKIPVGFKERFVTDEEPKKGEIGYGCKQRKF